VHIRILSLIVACGLVLAAPWGHGAEWPPQVGKSSPQLASLVALELGVPRTVATRYVDSLGEAVSTLLMRGQRVALDGLGAFEVVYKVDPETDEVLYSVAFRFDLGRAIEHPCMKTVFDGDVASLASALDSAKVAASAGGSQALTDPLGPEDAARLLDLAVFAILYVVDQNGTLRLGDSLGDFFGTVELAAPAQDYNSSRSNKANSIAADFSDAVLDDADDTLIQRYAGNAPRRPDVRRVQRTIQAANQFHRDVLALIVATHREQNPDDNRPNSRLVVSDAIIFGVAQAVVAAAQDHNASRSNKTSAVVNTFVEDLVDEAAGAAKAQDYNSSRSNKARGEAWSFNDDLDDVVLDEVAAQDHNASRSNKTSAVVGGFGDEIIGDIEDQIFAAIVAAQDHNASRSNKTRAAAADLRGQILAAIQSSRAQDYNSSRSNKARGSAAKLMDGLIRLMWLSQLSDDLNSGGSGQGMRLSSGIIADVAEEAIAAAQDHNASRSNKTSAIIDNFTGELVEEAAALALAQDYNSSRSNKANSIVDRNLPLVEEAVVEDLVAAGYAVVGAGGAAEDFMAVVEGYFTRKVRGGPDANAVDYDRENVQAHQPDGAAQDHNASRSNRRASSPYFDKVVETYGAKAQDYNSSRSNKARGIMADFDPSPTLLRLMNRH